MTDPVEITVLNEALVEELYEEGAKVKLWGGLEFTCEDGYMTAITTATRANTLVQEGRVLRLRLID